MLRIFIIVGIILSCNLVNGQIPTSFILPFLDESETKVLESRSLKLNIPNGFEMGFFETECFDNKPFIHRIISCSNNKIITKDGNCITFIPIWKLFSGKEPDSIAVKQYYENWEFKIEHFHINQISAYIRSAYGEDAKQNWKDYVNYYSPDKPKEIFNADTAITFDIKIPPDQYYLNKFSLIRFLFIQKKGKAFNMLISFYSDAALKDRKKYDQLNDSLYRYEN